MFMIFSSVGAALYGLCALITKFKHENGRFNFNSIPVMIGIGAAATLSILSSVLGKFESAETQFHRQTEVLSAVEKDQQHVLTDDVTVLIEYEYSVGGMDDDFMLFENSALWITVADKLETAPLPFRPLQQTSREGVNRLVTSWSKSSKHVHRTVDDKQWTQRSRYAQFDGTLGKYEDLVQWNGAQINIVLSTEFNTPLREWRQTMDDGEEEWLRDSARSKYPKEFERSEQPMDDYTIAPLSCRATVRLVIKDSVVGSIESMPVTVREWDEDVRGAIYIRWPTITCPDDFFTPTDYGRPPDPPAVVIKVLAWCCVGLMSLSILWIVIKRVPVLVATR